MKKLDNAKQKMVGKQFERLLVKEFAYQKNGHFCWTCLCSN